MTNVLIVYATIWGNTKKIAENVAKGAQEVENTSVVVREAEVATIEEVKKADALILGTGVHMGSMDWKVKKFIDDVCSKLWMKDEMIGKVGAVFATGGGFGSAGGGCELTMLSMMNNLVELGMIIVPLPKNTPGYPVGGLQWGPYARSMGVHGEQTGVSEDTFEVAHHHGKNVAYVAKVIKEGRIFST